MPRHPLNNNVTGIALNAYMTVNSFAIFAALPFSSASCSIITEFCAGGIQPSIKSVNVTIARVLALSTGSKLANERRRTVASANIGERTKRENRSEMIVFGCTDDDFDSEDDEGEDVSFFTSDPARTNIAAGR
jgi:hypothetical protein